jgi:hypothetical protein
MKEYEKNIAQSMHRACTGKKRHAYNILVRNPEGKKDISLKM